MQTSGSLSDATFNKKGFQSEIGLKNHLVTKLVFPHLLAISLERLITPLELCIDLNNFCGTVSKKVKFQCLIFNQNNTFRFLVP